MLSYSPLRSHVKRRTVIVNIHDLGSQAFIAQAMAEDRFVAIHRPTKWSNPFSHRPNSAALFKVDSAQEALRRYAAWLPMQAELMAALADLQGRVLGCFCAPRPCHGYILARFADELDTPA